MLPVLAWIAALSVTAEEPAPLPTDPSVPTEPAPTSPPASLANYLVRIDLGPELARRMGVRVVVRPTGDNFGNRRSAVALELPLPVSADLPPNAASIRLPAGVWRIEASAPGFLPSTREFTVDATTPDQTLAWPLLPSCSHSDISFPITATNSPGVAIRVRSANGDSWTCATQHTTCTLRLARGSFTVEARANGFQPVSQSFVVAAGPPVSVPITLVAAGTPRPASGHRAQVPAPVRHRPAVRAGCGPAS